MAYCCEYRQSCRNKLLYTDQCGAVNKEYVESSDTIGKMCMPEEKQDSIRIAITTNKKIRDKIKVSDITATADLQQAVSLDTNPVMVPITVTCSVPGVTPNDIKCNPSEPQCESG